MQFSQLWSLELRVIVVALVSCSAVLVVGLVVVDAGLAGDSRGLSRSRNGPGALRSLLGGRPSKGDALPLQMHAS